MNGEYQRGRKPLVRAHVQPKREPALFRTTGGVSYYLHKCGLFDESDETARPQRRYRNLSENMSNLQNSFSNGDACCSNAKSKTPKVLARFTTGAEAVADLTRCCPSYCSSGLNSRSCIGASRSFNRSAANNSSMFIGTPSMLDARSGSQLGSRQRSYRF